MEKQRSFKILDRIWKKTEGIKLPKKDMKNAIKAVRAKQQISYEQQQN